MPKKKQTEQTAEETQRRCAGLISFGTDVRKLLGPLLGKKGMIQADVLAHWQDILGPDLASGVTPFSVSFSKRNEGALLTVKAFSGAYAVEFTARKEQIKERLNSYFGYAAISDIRIQQGGTFSSPQSKQEQPIVTEQQKNDIQQLTAEIENEALRESVVQLGLLLMESKKD